MGAAMGAAILVLTSFCSDLFALICSLELLWLTEADLDLTLSRVISDWFLLATPDLHGRKRELAVQEVEQTADAMAAICWHLHALDDPAQRQLFSAVRACSRRNSVKFVMCTPGLPNPALGFEVLI